MVKKYRIRYQKTDYSFGYIDVEAENKRDAVNKFSNPRDSSINNLSPKSRRILLANTKELNGDEFFSSQP